MNIYTFVFILYFLGCCVCFMINTIILNATFIQFVKYILRTVHPFIPSPDGAKVSKFKAHSDSHFIYCSSAQPCVHDNTNA